MKIKGLLYASIFVLALLTGKVLLAIHPQDVDLSPLTGRIVTVNDPEYDAVRLGWNLYFSRFPLAIVFPQNKQDVVNAVNFCRENKIAFRIRSGRHALAGWSTLDGGIIIDFREMKGIRYNQKKGLAFVQPGVIGIEAVPALAKFGVGIPNGLERTPGVGGVVLGGGIGLSIREHGLSCDHLVEVEIVLASGKIVRARKDNKYKDLFFACQGGGGGNFGVVTEFVFAPFPRGNVTLFKVEYPYETLETLVDTWQNWAPFQTKRLNSAMELFTGTNHDIIGTLNGSQEELLQILAPMLAIPGSHITALATVPYVDSWLFFSADLSPPTNDKFSSTFVYKLLPPEAIRIIKNALDNPVNANANFWFLALGGVMKKISKTATPFWNRDALFYFEWDESWSNDHFEQAGPAIAWVENIRAALRPFIKGSYVNVPDLDIPNWQKEYYGKNFKKLQKIKTKYDPDNLFTYEIQAIPPLKK